MVDLWVVAGRGFSPLCGEIFHIKICGVPSLVLCLYLAKFSVTVPFPTSGVKAG